MDNTSGTGHVGDVSVEWIQQTDDGGCDGSEDWRGICYCLVTLNREEFLIDPEGELCWR